MMNDSGRVASPNRLSSQAIEPPSSGSLDPPGVDPAREWTLWSDERTPNARGAYRFRATFPFLGVTVTAEWTEEHHLCGMGYGDSEWWPLSPCHWDGYRRYITNKTLEWRPPHADDPEGIVWHGLDLLPCPFTGKDPKLEPSGQYIGAPLWRSEAVWISSPGVPKRRWTDAAAMRAAWNRRAPASAMSAGTAETAQQAQGQRPASAVGEAETPDLSIGPQQ